MISEINDTLAADRKEKKGFITKDGKNNSDT